MKKTVVLLLTILLAVGIFTFVACEENPDGHEHTFGDWKTVTAATCTEKGVKERTCTVEGCTEKQTEEIAATGHAYGTPVYTWAADNATCTATRTCQNNTSHVETETVNATSTTTATCTAAGTRTYKATFTNATFSAQTKEVAEKASGHNYIDGLCSICNQCAVMISSYATDFPLIQTAEWIDQLTENGVRWTQNGFMGDEVVSIEYIQKGNEVYVNGSPCDWGDDSVAGILFANGGIESYFIHEATRTDHGTYYTYEFVDGEGEYAMIVTIKVDKTSGIWTEFTVCELDGSWLETDTFTTPYDIVLPNEE